MDLVVQPEGRIVSVGKRRSKRLTISTVLPHKPSRTGLVLRESFEGGGGCWVVGDDVEAMMLGDGTCELMVSELTAMKPTPLQRCEVGVNRIQMDDVGASGSFARY